MSKNETKEISKVLENRITNISLNPSDPENKLTYKDLALVCLQTKPERGFSIEEMRERLDIIKKVELLKEEGEILLSGKEMNIISRCAHQMTWSFIHEDIIGFVDYVNGVHK